MVKSSSNILLVAKFSLFFL